SELDVTLAGSEYLVQAEVRLHHANRTAVSKIPRAALADQLPAFCDIVSKLIRRGLPEHPRIGEIDHRVFPDVIDAHEIRLNIRVEEGLVCALRRLDVVGAAAGSGSGPPSALDDAKVIGLLHEGDTNIAPDRS